MTGAARNSEIPPAPFVKGGVPRAAFRRKWPIAAVYVRPPSGRHAFSPLKKGGQGGFAPGFTLVEVIVTILMAGIMGAFFIQFMGTAMSKSTRAIENVREEAAAESIMEQIVAEYVTEINKDDPRPALETIRGRSYGNSLVSVNMGYITFNLSGAKQTTTLSRTLQVTVRPAQAPGNELVTLLTESRQAGSPTSPPVAY